MTEPDADLAKRNRRTLARRSGWPAGALAECERLDLAYPGWTFAWLHANHDPEWARPAGFGARRLEGRLAGGDELRRGPDDGVARVPWCFGPDIPTLERKILRVEEKIAAREAEVEEERAWARLSRSQEPSGS